MSGEARVRVAGEEGEGDWLEGTRMRVSGEARVRVSGEARVRVSGEARVQGLGEGEGAG